tara:strand:+ start:7536 stop:9524 length:1989 start_codon:yes stop_codon:yes gene_type:complete
MKNINQNTNYWTGNLTGSSDMWWREEEEKKGRDVVALASYRSAITNYVNIVTGRTDIPVTYNSSDESFTDGKKVYLSGSMNDKNFDPSVGLALHEGSHIKHTDFELLRSLERTVQKYFKLPEDSYEERIAINDHTSKVKDLLNYVEDRRIDYIIFKSAPGYKNYYHAMYDKYFHFRVIDKALRSQEYRETNWESYIFRIMNFTNQNTDLNALPGLRTIYRTIDLKNISRLKNTEDALQVAMKVYSQILSVLPEPTKEDQDEEQNDQQQSGSGSSNGEGTEVNTGDKKMDADSQPTQDETDPNELTDSQKRSLQNAIQKQKKLQDGSMKKTKLTKAEKSSIKSVEDSGAYDVEVGTGSSNRTRCVVYPALTDRMLDREYSHRGNLYPFIGSKEYKHWGFDDTDKAVREGIIAGKMLGKKLEVRNEETTTKWTRQESGRIDKRLIAELGFNNDRVFKTTLTERYNDAFMHISIDGSGSMDGAYLQNALKSAAAVCQAATMAGNIHVQVSLRTTLSVGNAYKPLIVVLYDSSVNKMIHIKKFWGHIKASGTTPEGLCFEALSKQIIKDSNGRDAYFLNYSDGMPYFDNRDVYYSGSTAEFHTRDEVSKLRKQGINILSFFITDPEWSRESTLKSFRRMYGKDATTIDPTKMMPLAKELNKKFLQK